MPRLSLHSEWTTHYTRHSIITTLRAKLIHQVTFTSKMFFLSMLYFLKVLSLSRISRLPLLVIFVELTHLVSDIMPNRK